MTVPLNLCQSHGNILEMMCVSSIEWLHHAAKCNNRKNVCAFCRRTDSTTVKEQIKVLRYFYHCVIPVKHLIKTVLKDVHCTLLLRKVQ